MMERDRRTDPEMARTIETSRIVNVPRERVIRAWTDPDRLARWWGPKDFTNTFHQCDPRTGGDVAIHDAQPEWGELRESEHLRGGLAPGTDRDPPPLPTRFPADRVLRGPRRTDADRVANAVRNGRVAENVRGFAPAANEQNLDRLEAELARTA